MLQMKRARWFEFRKGCNENENCLNCMSPSKLFYLKGGPLRIWASKAIIEGETYFSKTDFFNFYQENDLLADIELRGSKNNIVGEILRRCLFFKTLSL